MERFLIKEAIKKVGEKIAVAGWVSARRDHGQRIFADLRDISGTLQIVFGNQDKELHQLADALRTEWVIWVKGEIKKRPDGMENPEIETGDIEMTAEKIEVLNRAETLPFEIDSDKEIGEEIRLKYRYLDLRQSKMKRNIFLRHRVVKFIRDYFCGKGFIEIETPLLTKSTPEGARDFVVPSRLHPGKFYALPQSPQQYKQLLMVSGFERYFQIARCIRDEDTRGDRQPEFTQVDVEMSFTGQEDIMNLIETLFINLIKTEFSDKKITKIPFPRLTYQKAMEKYQSDRPDLRKDKNSQDELAFVWIVDFPMFEWKETENRWDATHHPFTMPRGIDIQELKKNPGKILAYQYDIVLNGFEIGGGSIRTHKPEVLEAVFEILGHTKEAIHEKFGHLLKAFQYGAPPHGGIALGLDRLVMVLAKEKTIREVIVFPKTGDGRDLMMNAPSEIDQAQLKELGIKIASR